MRLSFIRAVVVLIYASILACSGSNGPGNGYEPPTLIVQIEDARARVGDEFSVSVTLSRSTESACEIDSLSSFNLLIGYRYDVLQLLGVTPGGGDSLWEHFEYLSAGIRDRQAKRDAIRITARRDIADGIAPSSLQAVPIGTIASLRFRVNPRSEFIGDSAEVGFQSLECEDNTFVDGGDASILHFMSDYDSRDSLSAPNDTLSCARRFRVVSDIRYHAGQVRVGAAQGDMAPLPGDVDLDGIASNIVDVIRFQRAFVLGDSVFDNDPLIHARQLAACDVNRDGIPLHIADYDMIRRAAFTDLDIFEPRETPSGNATLSKLDWGVQIATGTPISLVYVVFELDSTDTSTTIGNVFPAAREVLPIRDGNRLRLVIDYFYYPLLGEFTPLMIDFNSTPQRGFRVLDVQLSTPPGLAVPVKGFGYPR